VTRRSSPPSHSRETQPTDRHAPDGETDEERAEELARETAEENPDPITRREAIEQVLEDEDLSEEGEELGEHNA
jgi:hypothetical protein